MRIIRYSTKAKKDLKKYRNNIELMKGLFEILKKLENEEPIPSKYKPHSLIGDYKDCMECHVENDFLLIWIDKISGIVEIVRIGTHSELFEKKRR